MSCQCKDRSCISKVGVFSGLPHDKQCEIIEQASQREKARGEYLLEEGEKIDSIMIIRSGRVKINRYDEDGKEYILDIRSGSETIGEDIFFLDEYSPYNAICVTDVKLCEISRKYILELFARDPDFAWSMITELNRKLKETNNLLEILQENDARLRIALFLSERSDRLDSNEITLTVDDIAASIGMRKETISRKLVELQGLGLIKRVGNRRIIISDKEKLKDFKNN